MLNTYTWKVVPSSQPVVVRSCPKCGGHSEFESSGNFRVNANKNHLDVWMIYQCRKCKSTWNMEILSRVNPNSIDKELYLKFLRNDKELAKQYAFDISLHNSNGSDINYAHLPYDIIPEAGILPSPKESFQLELVCEYPLDIRLDKLLSLKLNISREKVRKMCKAGQITGKGIKDIGKAKLKSNLLIYFNC